MIKLLLYCNKTKSYLVKRNILAGVEPAYFILKENIEDKLNGKIIAECDFWVEEIRPEKYWHSTEDFDYIYNTGTLYYYDLLRKSCLMGDELDDYLGCEDKGYAVHLNNLHIFDKPRDIREFYNIPVRAMADCMNQRALSKAPKNMCNAYDAYKNHYIAISIKPEDLCKILNREKTIEVRKKVLKEMLKDE